eukprot:12286353-Karenia_brevis.AAC.1
MCKDLRGFVSGSAQLRPFGGAGYNCLAGLPATLPWGVGRFDQQANSPTNQQNNNQHTNKPTHKSTTT